MFGRIYYTDARGDVTAITNNSRDALMGLRTATSTMSKTNVADTDYVPIAIKVSRFDQQSELRKGGHTVETTNSRRIYNSTLNMLIFFVTSNQ